MNNNEEYFSRKAISNSLLGTLHNPRWLKIKIENPDTEDDDKVHFRIGSALDCLLTTPELWDELFIVIDAKRPSGFMGKFIDNLPGGLDPLLSDINAYREAYNKAGYKAKIETIIAKLWASSELTEYYLSTRNIDRSKTILSRDEYDQVVKAKELILANEFTEYYFKSGEQTDGLTELLSQVAIYFTYMEEDCKALLDGILINHEAKTIQPYDLKTIGKSINEFQYSYLSYGYYRQAAFYELALQYHPRIIELELNGYKVLDFIFIVVESKITSTHPAVIFKTCLKDRVMGLVGGTVKGKSYKGISELINEYKFYRDNNYWNLPMDIYLNNGVVNLDVFDNE